MQDDNIPDVARVEPNFIEGLWLPSTQSIKARLEKEYEMAIDLEYTNIYQKGEQLYDDLGFGSIASEQYNGNVENDLRDLWQADAIPPDEYLSDDEIIEAARIITAYLETLKED